MTEILVIEDEAAILGNVIEILELEGFDAIGADNGHAGVALAQQHQPDLIICDIMMPGLDGYGVLLALLNDPATAMIPFIYLTAKVERAAMRYGMELGADDYLTKPFTAEELLTAVYTRLEKHAAVVAQYERKLDELRGNIIHMLPHELRTPLVSIMGYSELLMWDSETLDRERVVNMAASINRASVRLYRLIENFLVYAQIELLSADPSRLAGLKNLWVNHPSQMVYEVSQAKAQEAERASDLQIELAEDKTIQIVMDDLKKIVTELADNAFKFSETGTPVHITTHIDNGSYIVRFTNRGRGMTREQIAHIGAGMQFERRLYEQQGAGLGLVIAKRLTELHGGELTIQSEPGQTTTLQVALTLGVKAQK